MRSFSVVCPVATGFKWGASMQRMPAVSRPAWMMALSGFADRDGAPRRSPVEIVATMGSYLTRTQAAEVSGLRAGPFGRWADGVSAMREDCAAFARHWQAHNDRVLAERGGSGPPPQAARPAGSSPPGSAQLDGPLWVVLGDSTAQGLGAPSPDGGYVGQVLAELRRTTGLPWRVLNLSVSGSLTRDVIGAQLPRLPAGADLVTCGIGVNDILYTSPAKLFADLRALIAAVPDQTVLLDLPLPAGAGACSAGPACRTSPGSTGPSTRPPPPAACRSPRSPRTSCRPGPASSPRTTSIPARTATVTGPGPCSPPPPRPVRYQIIPNGPGACPSVRPERKPLESPRAVTLHSRNDRHGPPASRRAALTPARQRGAPP